jgi:hypothetical protein
MVRIKLESKNNQYFCAAKVLFLFWVRNKV